MLKFHLGENVDPAIAVSCRKHGIDCTSTNEVGLRTSDDPVQLAHCRKEGRVIVSSDVDMLILLANQFDHPGLVFMTKQSVDVGYVVKALIRLNRERTPQTMLGWTEYV